MYGVIILSSTLTFNFVVLCYCNCLLLTLRLTEEYGEYNEVPTYANVTIGDIVDLTKQFSTHLDPATIKLFSQKILVEGSQPNNGGHVCPNYQH